jgi:hypothetical protein
MTTVATPSSTTPSGSTARSGRLAAGYAAVAGGIASVVAGAIQAVRVDDGNPVVGASEHVLLTLFALALLLWIPGYLALGRGTGGRVGRIGGHLAAAGCGLLAVGATSTNLHDQDYAWFVAVAIPANAAWLFGSIMLAVATYRARTLPRPLAVGVAFVWVTSIILSQAGGNLLAGLIWAVVGWLLVAGTRRP